MLNSFPGRRRVLACGVIALLAGCSEAELPTQTAIDLPSAAPDAGVEVRTAVNCDVQVRLRQVNCAAAPAIPGVTARILGGQDLYMTLHSSSVNYDSTTDAFTFDVAVQNLITLDAATADGVVPDSNGVIVFLTDFPTVTAGSGSVGVFNATGLGTFTEGFQPYWRYRHTKLGSDSILSSGETTDTMQWYLDVPGEVISFSMTAFISTITPPGAAITIAPQISDVTPDTIVANNIAQITASNLSLVTAENTVRIGGMNAPVLSSTPTVLTVVVPCFEGPPVAVPLKVQITTNGKRGMGVMTPAIPAPNCAL